MLSAMRVQTGCNTIVRIPQSPSVGQYPAEEVVVLVGVWVGAESVIAVLLLVPRMFVGGLVGDVECIGAGVVWLSEGMGGEGTGGEGWRC